MIGRPDVLVVGAGSAGVAAAVAAARRGADTWLIEQSGFVGGLATFGLINLLLTLDDGAGTPVVAGLCQEWVDRLDQRGAARHPGRQEWGSEDPLLVERWRRWGLVWGAPPEAVRYSVAYDAEAFADVCLEALQEAGVRLRLFTWFAGAVVEGGGIKAVMVESKAGREVIVPRIVVDGSGDGDVVVTAGAEHDRVATPLHLWFRVGGVDHEGDWSGALAFRAPGRGRALVPWGPHPGRVDACDPDDLTRAVIAARWGARAELQRMQREVPAFSDSWLDDHARLPGITESRRLVGDHVLAKEEGDVPFPDSVARTGHWTRRHVVYDIPYRCLTAPGLSNVLAAGRCISTTRYVHQATKEIPAAMATGEAAGAAAAMAAAAGVDVHAIDVAALRDDLGRAGALVGGHDDGPARAPR